MTLKFCSEAILSELLSGYFVDEVRVVDCPDPHYENAEFPQDWDPDQEEEEVPNESLRQCHCKDLGAEATTRSVKGSQQSADAGLDEV